jgi:nicotinate-nucleotide pyrophosphorylase (carboxylating)
MNDDDLAEVVARALVEDLGSGDVTSRAIVPPDAAAVGVITQKELGVLSGMLPAELAFRGVDRSVGVERLAPEGEWLESGPVLRVTGPARGVLAAERTALNFLAHLSGIATLTARAVAAVQGTGTRILDTRKTTPGLRALEKAAVRAGGGVNHRRGLYDAVLIKENHAALAGGVGEAVRRAVRHADGAPVEVECRTVDEVEEALEAGAGRLLLDNMNPDGLRDAVARAGGRAELEASGRVTLENLSEVASTGVQFISIGALTHSAPALDLSLSLEPFAS